MSYETKNIRNVCLLGHGGSGKTTLAESMLYMTGAIDRQGKTADGNTVCDYDPEEIKRQITISTSIAPVNFGGCKINVLDCPGFFDFAGDVMCALRAVEAGIIFCTAKDGIAVGAERSWKYLKNANMPCMFYVSKTNEDHGDFAAVLSALQEKHGSAVCAVTAPMSDGTGVIDLVHNVAYQTNGNKTAKVAVPAADADMVESLRETLFAAPLTAASAPRPCCRRSWITCPTQPRSVRSPRLTAASSPSTRTARCARSCSRPFPTSSASTPSSRCSPARSRPICLCATCA